MKNWKLLGIFAFLKAKFPVSLFPTFPNIYPLASPILVHAVMLVCLYEHTPHYRFCNMTMVRQLSVDTVIEQSTFFGQMF